MQKDFDSWNEVKRKIDTEQSRFYKTREIWWCRFGVNIGTEQNGRGRNFLRPIIVLRGFSPEACLVVPLTTSNKKHSLRIPVGIIGGKEASANISQLRVLDTRRFVERIGVLEKQIFMDMRKTVRELL